jgi:hypothetical protein
MSTNDGVENVNEGEWAFRALHVQLLTPAQDRHPRRPSFTRVVLTTLRSSQRSDVQMSSPARLVSLSLRSSRLVSSRPLPSSLLVPHPSCRANPSTTSTKTQTASDVHSLTCSNGRSSRCLIPRLAPRPSTTLTRVTSRLVSSRLLVVLFALSLISSSRTIRPHVFSYPLDVLFRHVVLSGFVSLFCPLILLPVLSRYLFTSPCFT